MGEGGCYIFLYTNAQKGNATITPPPPGGIFVGVRLYDTSYCDSKHLDIFGNTMYQYQLSHAPLCRTL